MNNPKTTIVIFGATGDLAKRKLYPSIYNLFKGKKIGHSFAVIGIARTKWTDQEFQQVVKETLHDEDNVLVEEFCQHFYYLPFDVQNKTSFQELDVLLKRVEDIHQIPGNRIFYMAMAPEFFGTIASNLKKEGVTSTQGWKRLIIEKPFGHDLPSAKKLNEEIRESFSEGEIYRIDHYLGKEMVQNIEVIRFGNAIFEPLWNNHYISNIQITSSETLGVEERGGYYEKSGALRDMVQNHMLQMVSLLAMDPPIRITPEEIRSEKIKMLRALRQVESKDVSHSFVRGQYQSGFVLNREVCGYRDEPNVAIDSNTETFVAGKLLIDSHRWAGVPFYIRTGKRMSCKSTEIVVQFRELPMNLYKKGERVHPNLLKIHIQPDEGITLILNGKKLDAFSGTIPVELNYSNNGTDKNNTPEAYERLLYDCMLGDATNFAHWDEVELSWKFIDPISHAWNNDQDLPFYEAGSMGPRESDALLHNGGFHWWPISQQTKC